MDVPGDPPVPHHRLQEPFAGQILIEPPDHVVDHVSGFNLPKYLFTAWVQHFLG